jgi:hypothetical protein
MWTLIKTGLGLATGGLGTAALSVVGWLLKHWKLSLGLLVVLAIGISFKVLLVERDNARAQVAADAKTIKTLGDQKAALQANVTVLTATIKAQSDSIDGLSKAAAAKQAEAAKAVQAAKDRNAKDAATIAALQKRAADKSNGGTCDAEIARIRAGL